MAKYIYQLENWPGFEWEAEKLSPLLSEVRFTQGKLIGRMEALGFDLQQEASLETLTLEVLKSSEIEGELLNSDEVRSSIARKLGMDVAGLVASDRNVDGVVEMMLDATQRYEAELTPDRLFAWHASLFPTGRSGMHKIVTGAWRNNSPDDPMQVISGAMGKEKVHYQAPEAAVLDAEMKAFCDWFNSRDTMDPVMKAAISHLWFVTIHPFDDGNGRIARAITEMQLSRADNNQQRFYSMSAQIRKERIAYYQVLERTQQNTLNISNWLQWFLQCLQRALQATGHSLQTVMSKARFWEQHKESGFNKRQLLMLNKLLDGIDGKLSSSKWAKMAKCSADTAVRDINDLIERGVLAKDAGGGRSTSYVFREY
ncbi:MAG: Fic family protein [Sphingobacteriales bacterium]|nr:MAG: Fic family protein [Sphingobacteriales bacterium]